MPPIITGLTATTELEAVNAMRSAVGEAPLTDLTSTATDVTMAVNILRNATREVQSMGWRFNTEFGYELAPSQTLAWSGSDGSSDTLNVFTPPTGLIDYTVTPCDGQVGWNRLDTTLRPPRTAGLNLPLVFYDRAKNRDGFAQSERPFLYINPTWLFDFVALPEAARRYITVRAAREYAEQVQGSGEQGAFSEKDELFALRNLKRLEGMDDDCNMFNNGETAAILGYRTSYPDGPLDNRKSPGPSA